MNIAGKIKHLLYGIVFALMLAALPGRGVLAAEPDLSENCRLNLVFQMKYGGQQYVFSDVEITIYRVADFESDEDGSVSWSMTKEFEGSGVKLKKIGFSGIVDDSSLVDTAVKWAEEKAPAGITGAANEVGSVVYEALSPGLYLVCMTKSSERYDNFHWMPPFYVALPNQLTEEEWQSDVTMYPKLIAQEADTPSAPDSGGTSSAATPSNAVTRAIGSGLAASGDVLSGLWGLPRTGLLIWPILLLLPVGFVLLLVGAKLVLGGNKDEEDEESEKC